MSAADLGPAAADGEGFPGLAAPRPRPAPGMATATAGPVATAAPLWLSGAAVLMLLIFSRAWISPLVGPGADAEGGLIRTLFFPGYALGLFLIAGDPRGAVRAALAGALPLALVLTAFASAAWSIAPDLTLRRALALLFTTLAGVGLAARFGWRDLARVLAATFGLLALGSAAAALALPHLGKMDVLFPGAWRGLWGDKNALGGFMALGVWIAAGAAVLDRRLRGLWVGAAVLCLALVVLSTSKTALLSLGAGAGAFGLLAVGRRSPALAIGAVLSLAVGAVALGGLAWTHPKLLPSLIGKDLTLTGRTVIWDTVLRRIAERPATGFGYAVVWNDASGWGPLAWIVKEAHFTPHHAHNSWLEAWLELGYAGLALLVAFAALTAWRLVRRAGTEGAWLAAPVLAAFFVTTLTETVTLEYNDFLWVIVPALSMRLALRDPARARGRAAPESAAHAPAALRPWAV